MPLTLEDKQAIAELVARYNFALDHLRIEEWVDTFTDDGELRTGDKTQCKGRSNRIAFLEQARAKGHRSRHWAANLVIDGDDDVARLRMYVLSIAINNGIEPYIIGEYDDTLVKVNGEWRFKRRHVTVVTGTPFNARSATA